MLQLALYILEYWACGDEYLAGIEASRLLPEAELAAVEVLSVARLRVPLAAGGEAHERQDELLQLVRQLAHLRQPPPASDPALRGRRVPGLRQTDGRHVEAVEAQRVLQLQKSDVVGEVLGRVAARHDPHHGRPLLRPWRFTLLCISYNYSLGTLKVPTCLLIRSQSLCDSSSFPQK